MIAWMASLSMICSTGFGATLTAGTESAGPGAMGVAVDIGLTNGAGDAVSAAQFNLVFDDGNFVLTDVAAGAAAQSAGKDVTFNTVSPGVVRIVIAGLNQTAIPDGLLAAAVFEVDAGALPGFCPIVFEEASLSDPYGFPVDFAAFDGGILVSGAEGEGEGSAAYHSADQDSNYAIGLSELLRLIQFYNLEALHCEPDTEDGYAPGAGDTGCTPHDSDYDFQDWIVSLAETLRLVQIFNADGYYPCPGQGTEDGFCPVFGGG